MKQSFYYINKQIFIIAIKIRHNMQHQYFINRKGNKLPLKLYPDLL